MALRLYSKVTHALRYWLLHRLPTCKRMAHVMSESLERPLTLRERVLLRLHLWVCIWCVWYLEHLQLMRSALNKRAQQLSETDSASTVSLSLEARERIKRALSQQSR